MFVHQVCIDEPGHAWLVLKLPFKDVKPPFVFSDSGKINYMGPQSFIVHTYINKINLNFFEWQSQYSRK